MNITFIVCTDLVGESLLSRRKSQVGGIKEINAWAKTRRALICIQPGFRPRRNASYVTIPR